MMRARARIALVLAACSLASPARSVQPDEVMRNPEQEARARALSRELRCMVCQNQSIDDSDAPLARDLRMLVREKIAAGQTDQQVIDFLVSRYGEFVLLKPRVEGQTALLWLIPPLALFGGGAALWFYQRRRRNDSALAALHLTAEEEARLEKLIGEHAGPGSPHA
jgi:cytochrome c-type biogenesis protein CcmH